MYQSFCAFKSGVPFGEIGELSKAVGFIVFPFIAYLVSYVSRKSTPTLKKMRTNTKVCPTKALH